MKPEWVRLSGRKTLVEVDVQPGSKQSGVVGFEPWRGRLKVAVRSPPVDGAANAELVEIIAESLGVKSSRVSVEAGATNRRKTIAILGDHVDSLKALKERE
ncbi:MAG: DUF167 domain-containing protein [Candidatus Thalassarchaeaceae archaeon]|jgi:uncharacterized protein (TIGR00251 family)|nr:DUF167 domain-containing protein [Candidatus Thalassarchaeaceae archaeon]